MICWDCCKLNANIEKLEAKNESLKKVLRSLLKDTCSGECSYYQAEKSCCRFECTLFEARELLLEDE